MYYQIKAFFTTGDSFKSYKDEYVLPYKWDSLELAKENLQRLKEHYLWYKDRNSDSFTHRPKRLPEPEWHKSLPNEEHYDFVISLKLDNGNECVISVPWCGYFERLHSLEILVPPEDGMKFEFFEFR